jgi:hypothetical protein
MLKIEKFQAMTGLQYTNGLAESLIKMIKKGLATYSSRTMQDWDEYIHLIVYNYNCTFHSTTQESPFATMFNRNPRTLLENIMKVKVSAYTEVVPLHERLAQNFQQTWQKSTDNVEQAKVRQKLAYDTKVIPSKVKADSQVLIYEK